MKKCIGEIKYILTSREKRQTVGLFFLMLLGGLLELAGVAGVLPVGGAMASDANENRNNLLMLCVILIGIYVFKNVFEPIVSKELFHFIWLFFL